MPFPKLRDHLPFHDKKDKEDDVPTRQASTSFQSPSIPGDVKGAAPRRTTLDYLVNPAQSVQTAEGLDNAALSGLKDLDRYFVQFDQHYTERKKPQDSKPNGNLDSEDIPHKVLRIGKEVVKLLGSEAEKLPGGKALVSVLQTVIELELHRSANTDQIAFINLLMLHNIYMLHSVVPALDILNKTDLTEREKQLKRVLAEYVEKIMTSITDWGNFVDTYWKEKSRILHFLLAHNYKQKLNDFQATFTAFSDQLKDLVGSCMQVAANSELKNVKVQNEKILNLLEAQKLQIDGLSKLSSVIEATHNESEEDRQAALYVQNNGGVEAVIRDEALLEGVAKLLNEKLTAGRIKVLRTDFNEILEANRERYELKLSELGDVLQDTVKQSRDDILKRLEHGPHELVDDPDLKEIWKENKWKLSVKGRIFMDSVHEFYERQLLVREHSKEDPENVLHDRWILEVLSKPICQAAVGDIADDDGSGFVSISELNNFVNGRPQGWSVPEWFCFWACGWHHMNVQYQGRAVKQLSHIERLASGSLSAQYKPPTLKLLEALRTCIDISGVDDDVHFKHYPPRLAQLEKQYMDSEMNRISGQLRKLKFVIKDRSDLAFVTGQGRIELYFECILLELLKELNSIVETMQDHVAKHDDALIHIAHSFYVVFQAVWDRMNDLLQGWKAQARGADAQADRYLHGFFSLWYQERSKADDERALNKLSQWLTRFEGHGEYFIEEHDGRQHVHNNLELILRKMDEMTMRLAVLDEMTARLAALEAAVLKGSVHGAPNSQLAKPRAQCRSATMSTVDSLATQSSLETESSDEEPRTPDDIMPAPSVSKGVVPQVDMQFHRLDVELDVGA